MAQRTIYGMLAILLLVVTLSLVSMVRNGASAQSQPTPTSELNNALELAQNFSGNNGDWEPFVWEFDGVEMVLVPAGCFEMGSENGQDDERPVHRVCLSAFWIGQTEVTNAQYKRCVEAGVCTPPWDRRYYDSAIYADHPVIDVHWEQASDYANWIGGSLPTEAQWEYAARGPEGWVYPWGNIFDCHLGNFDDETKANSFVVEGGMIGCDGFDETAPVGSFVAGASWVGALDMSGNVFEWGADWYGEWYYDTLPDGILDPSGPESSPDEWQWHVIRGGNYFYYPDARAAYRGNFGPSRDAFALGFRVVVTRPVP